MNVVPLVGKQRSSVELATARLNVWDGSVRSSKTISSLIAWLLYVRTGPAGNLLMVGRTERTLKRNVIDPLVEMLGERRCRYVAGSGELWLLGRRVYIAGANDERAQEKIRGLTLVGAYVDEASTLPESFWAMLLTRLSIEGARLFATTNPDSPNHWLKRDYLDRARLWLRHDGRVETDGRDDRLDLARFSFQLADNPTLSAKYVADLAKEFTGLWRLRFIQGLWVLAEGAIYDGFDPTVGGRHVVAELPAVERWWLGVDYGTTNPFVALLVGVGVDERLYVAREWRWDSRRERRQLTDAHYSASVRYWLDSLGRPRVEGAAAELAGADQPDRLFVDPSAASFIVQLYGDGWAGVHGADNAVADGIRSVASLLGVGRLRIHQSCGGLVDEMIGYVWDPKASEDGVDKPVKVNDHGPDALRYAVMGTRRVWRNWLAVPFDDERPPDVS